MKLTSMATAEDDYACCPSDNKYGYGLTINISREQCEALGITKALTAGTVVRIDALAYVASSTSSVSDDDDDNGTEVSMVLQITDMGLDTSRTPADMAKRLFGSTP